MTDRRSLRALANLFETVLLGPGIVSHEGAHVLACRLTGIEVTNGPVLNPFADDAYIDHERVESFPADFAIAIAPLLLNTALGLLSFVLATLTSTLPVAVPLYWLGVCFALTAFPSVGDTETLYATVRMLPRWGRPLGYLLAVPLRTFTRLPGSAGIAGYVWIFVLFGSSRAVV